MIPTLYKYSRVMDFSFQISRFLRRSSVKNTTKMFIIYFPSIKHEKQIKMFEQCLVSDGFY